MRKNKRYSLLIVMVVLLVGLCLLPSTVSAAKKNSKKTTSKYTIYVNRQTNLVNVVKTKDKKLVRAMYCSTGKKNRTIKGTYYLKTKYRWRALVGHVYGQYSVRISGSYLFHSVPYTKKKATTLERAEYNKLGKQASKGCIRLSVADAKWIYDNCNKGTRVVINDTVKLKKPKYTPVKIPASDTSGWDPTDPNKKNPYYPTITLTNKDKTIEQGTEFDPLDQVKLYSKVTSEEELKEAVTVEGTVDTTTAGKYKVKYTLQDPRTELKVSKEYTFTVK